MKKLILSAAALLFFFAAQAQTEATAPASGVTKTETPAQDKKTEIKYDELPQAVKTTLSGDAYKGWEVVKVWHNTTKDNYEIEVKNAGGEAKTLKFGNDGKEITTL
jgi:hypothetical protein